MSEANEVQPKFKIIFDSDDLPDLPGIDRLLYWCTEFHKTGLTPSYGKGTLGNLSFRVRPGSDEFVITASAAGSKDRLSKSDFVLVRSVDIENMVVHASGKRPPSSETMLHSAIYKERRDVNAVFHGHCAKILDNAGRFNIIVTAKVEDYGSRELVDSVTDILGNNSFLIMKGHGFLSLGNTTETAGKAAIDIYNRCA